MPLMVGGTHFVSAPFLFFPDFLHDSFIGLVNGFIFTILLRVYWPQAFTSDSEVSAGASQILPIMWLYGFWDVIKCVSMAVLRAYV